jgi:hypothetical protein
MLHKTGKLGLYWQYGKLICKNETILYPAAEQSLAVVASPAECITDEMHKL